MVATKEVQITSPAREARTISSMQIHPRTFPQQWASKVRHWNYNILLFRLARRRSPLPILRGVYHSLTIGYFSYGVWENLRGAYRSLIISYLWDLWDVWGNLSASGLPPDAASSRLDAFAGPPAQVHHHHHKHLVHCSPLHAIHFTLSRLTFMI